MINVGEINLKIFNNHFHTLTATVILTTHQLEHIKERHPNDYERFSGYIVQILQAPDYIVEANKPDSAVLLKEINGNDRFQVILRLKSKNDPPDYQNSIITFMRIGKSRYEQMIRNKKVIYKSQ